MNLRQSREQIVDLSAERLGPGWLRRRPTEAQTRESIGAGVWCTGPQHCFRDALIAALDGATDVAMVCSFLLAEDRVADAMLRASSRGVRVYVLTASERRVGRVVREDDSFEQRMAEEHSRLLDRLSGKVLVRSAEHIHAKFLVTDPGSSASARAWISTANFNKALHDNLEIGVRLEGPAARALADVFQWAFWCEAERESRSAGRLAAIRPAHPAAPARPAGHAILATLRESQLLRERVITMIGDARREVIVATYGLSREHPAVDALVHAARRGVRVTVLTRPRPAIAEGAATLVRAGVSVVAHEKLHAKALVVDGQALVMSANLEPQGLDRGFEVGALLSTDASRAVEECLREWADSFPWIFRVDATRGEHLGEFCPAAASLRDGVVRVTDSHTQRLPSVIATDALALESALMPSVPRPPRDELPRRMMLAWDVVAPTLPSAARERFREIDREQPNTEAEPSARITCAPYEPRVFDQGSEVYVLLEEHSDADRVRGAAAALGATVVVR